MQQSISRNRRLLLGRLRKRKTRQREGSYLAEGIRCAGAVLESGHRVRFAIASESLGSSEPGALLLARLAERQVEVQVVEDSELGEVADTETPQGILLVAQEPDLDAADLLGPGSRLLLLDAVQDPGNVGTLVRAAAAFGLTGVIALDGTADPYGAKAVRASAGAIAQIPTCWAAWSRLGPAVESSATPLLVAGGEGEAIGQVAVPGAWALVLANEGAGARPEILGVAWRRVAIPMPGGLDSLNVGVAGAILMYVLAQDGATDAPNE